MKELILLSLLFAQVIFPNGTVIKAELALTPNQQTKGLMGRENLKENEGMLFVFPYQAIQTFWMKNMKFSIDIIWINMSGMVIGIEKNVPPCKAEPCEVYVSPGPVKYVLEVKAGKAKKEGLKIGDILQIKFVKEEEKAP